MNPWLRRVAPVITLLLLALPALAKKKDDSLTRMTPVPADQPIPVSDFFRPRLFANPELNPAGTHFAAMVSTKEDRTDLIAFDLETKTIERLTGGGEHDIDDYAWMGDRRLVFSIVHDKLYSTGLFAVELGDFSHSHALQRYNVMIPVGFPRDKPTEMIVWIRNSAKDRGADRGVIKIDTRYSLSAHDRREGYADDGLRAEVVASYPQAKDGVATAYLADINGELAFAVTEKDGEATLHRLVDDKWVKCTIDLDGFRIAGAGDVPGELLVYAADKAGKPNALYRYDTIAGKFGEKLYQDDTYDMTDARFYRHPVDGRVLGMQYDRKGPQSVWFDASYAGLQENIDAAFPNDTVRIIGSDRSEKQFFLGVYSDLRPMAYYHLDLEKKRTSGVANVAPWIDPQRMRPMQLITYETRDGVKMEGYVTLPAGASKENKAPLVVLPHGGPWARDVWGWNPEVQFLASRGYAVFQPNYRGSTSYAWRFPDQDMWAFRKMHDDVTDGVKTVLKTGLIDGERVAIMGGSFGGYLALCGAAYEKDLYRCAITVAGIFDWERVMKEEKGSEYMRASFGRLRRNLGDPKKNEEKFDEISPARHVDQITIPVFVAHGTEDVVAAVGQSRRLIANLKKYHVPYEKLIERGEGHGFQKFEDQVELYTAIEAFLAKNMTPRAAHMAAVPVATVVR